MTDVQQVVAADPQPPQQDVGLLIRQAVALRDKIKELNDEHAKKMKPYNETLDQLKGYLLFVLQQAGTDKMSKADSGTISKNQKWSAVVDDRDALLDHAIATGNFGMFNISANVEAVRQYVAANNGDTPPGVRLISFMDLSLRRPTKKA